MIKRLPLFRPLLLAGLLAVGFGTIWAILGLWCITVVEQATRHIWWGDQILVHADGTPVIREQLDNACTAVYQTLSGTELSDAEQRGKAMLDAAFLPVARPGDRQSFRLEWSQRIRAWNDGNRPATYWYFIHDGRRGGTGYFAGFSSQSNLCVGYLGQNGFRSDKPPESDRFRVDRQLWSLIGATQYAFGPQRPSQMMARDVTGGIAPWKTYLLSGDMLLGIDLRERTVTRVLEAPDIASVAKLKYAVPTEPDKQPELREGLAVRTADRIVLLDADGERRSSYVIPDDLRQSDLHVCDYGGPTVLAYRTDRKQTEGIVVSHFVWFNEQGEIVRREKAIRPGQPLGTFAAPDEFTTACVFSSVVPVPVLTGPAIGFWFPLKLLEEKSAQSYPEAVATMIAKTWPAMAGLNLFGLVLACLCVGRQRRYALRRTWGLFVFLFGLPGYVGYLTHRRWPALEPCPACQAMVPRDREACAACETPFPKPAAKGIEVFV